MWPGPLACIHVTLLAYSSKQYTLDKLHTRPIATNYLHIDTQYFTCRVSVNTCPHAQTCQVWCGQVEIEKYLPRETCWFFGGIKKCFGRSGWPCSGQSKIPCFFSTKITLF